MTPCSIRSCVVPLFLASLALAGGDEVTGTFTVKGKSIVLRHVYPTLDHPAEWHKIVEALGRLRNLRWNLRNLRLIPEEQAISVSNDFDVPVRSTLHEIDPLQTTMLR